MLPWLWQPVVAAGEPMAVPQPISFRSGPEGTPALLCLEPQLPAAATRFVAAAEGSSMQVPCYSSAKLSTLQRRVRRTAQMRCRRACMAAWPTAGWARPCTPRASCRPAAAWRPSSAPIMAPTMGRQLSSQRSRVPPEHCGLALGNTRRPALQNLVGSFGSGLRLHLIATVAVSVLLCPSRLCPEAGTCRACQASSGLQPLILDSICRQPKHWSRPSIH